MTIEKFHFQPPYALKSKLDLSAELDNLLLFCKDKKVIPPDHRIDLTPPGAESKYILRTKNANNTAIEDTVGELIITPPDQRPITEPVDADHQIILLCYQQEPPKTGISIDHIVLYTPSNGMRKQDEAVQAVGIPVEIPNVTLAR